jgi:hypothetical protein
VELAKLHGRFAIEYTFGYWMVLSL